MGSYCSCFNPCLDKFNSNLDKYIFNEKNSILYQLSVSLYLITFLVLSVTVGICYGLLFGTGEYAYATAQSVIISNTKSNSLNLAKEIAGAIQQELTMVAESITVSGAKYSQTLLSEATSTLASQLSYKEYNFNSSSCERPKCPSDYGDLYGNTRMPYIAGTKYGSLEHTSVYLYSSALNKAARDDATWNTYISSDSQISEVINSLPYQDQDFETLYSKGSNSTMFFYLSAVLFSSSGSDYYAIHRTYPGLIKNESAYNPSLRPWFSKAPVDSYYMYGPYRETFTKELVVTVSSKQTTYIAAGRRVTVVAAAVILLDNLQSIVTSITYANEGFGALLSYSDLSVLSWKNETMYMYNDATSSFYTLQSIDSAFYSATNNGADLKGDSTFQYTDSDGVEWVVASTPFFAATSYGSSTSSNSFILLTFAKSSSALRSMNVLRHNISKTTSSSSEKTGIIIASTALCIFLSSFLLVLYITKPLSNMKTISMEIVRMSVEDEEKKDFSKLIRDAFFLSSRSDEIGALTNAYFNILCLLHNRSQEKKNTPKYPSNPFYVQSPVTTWSQFFSFVEANYALFPQTSSLDVEVDVVVDDGADRSLDVLSSFSKAKTSHIDTDDIELRATNKVAHADSAIIKSSVKKIPVLYMATPMYEAIDYNKKKSITIFGSFKTKLNLLIFMLLSCMITVMVITVVDLSKNGKSWMTETTADMTANQIIIINGISTAKGAFVDYYFRQLYVNMLTLADYTTDLLDGNLTAKALLPTHYQTSYALDPDNLYAPSDASGLTSYLNYNYSGFFRKDYLGCASITDRCTSGVLSNETRLTSLLDLKMISMINPVSPTTFIQFGVDSTGFFRTYPYQLSASYWENPTSCLIQDTTLNSCYTNYLNSKCSYDTYNSYPTYDPRCRSWYAYGKLKNDPDVYFLLPRKSSSGSYVITAVAPVYTDSPLVAVLNSNSLVSTLTTSLNSLSILDNGYAYIIDSTNSSFLVMHPKASSSCSYVSCAEGFTALEYIAFQSNVLLPIQRNTLYGSGAAVSTEYTKDGATWKLSYQSIQFASYKYTIISTVPLIDILKASNTVNEKVLESIYGLIAAVVIFAALFLAILYGFSNRIITTVIEPINDLTNICTNAIEDDLERNVPNKCSSSDMVILLQAFSDLLISLRFGSETYYRGNVHRAQKLFDDALALFTATNNIKGIGASLNNLGATHMSLRSFEQSEVYYTQSINNCLFIIETLCESDVVKEKYSRVLSDRRGNLALLHLELGSPSDAFTMLEQLLESDKKEGYIKGCVVKQGILGQFYMNAKEYKSALRMHESCLKFIREKNETLYDASWNDDEVEASDQIALLNLAIYYVETKEPKKAEECFIELLTRGKVMNIGSFTKALIGLLLLFQKDSKIAEEVKLVASAFNFTIISAQVRQVVKRVAFVVDCSGSMSGSKITSARTNIQMILDKHMDSSDSVTVISFDNEIEINFPLAQLTHSNAEILKNQVIPNLYPRGSTAFFSAVDVAIRELENSTNGNDWIIALTDGEDNASKINQGQLIQNLQESSGVNIVAIGIGDDCSHDILKAISKATEKGVYISAAGNSESISQAFIKVAEVLVSSGNVLIEDL